MQGGWEGRAGEDSIRTQRVDGRECPFWQTANRGQSQSGNGDIMREYYNSSNKHRVPLVGIASRQRQTAFAPAAGDQNAWAAATHRPGQQRRLAVSVASARG